MGARTGEGHPLEPSRDRRQPGLAAGQGARHAGVEGRQHHHHRRLPEAAPAEQGRARADRRVGAAAQRGAREEVAPGAALDRRPAVAAGQRAARVATDREHRGPRRRLHRTRRQDDPAAPRRRKARRASRARHDREGDARPDQGASREAWIRRPRSEHERRLRPDGNAGRFAAREGDGDHVSEVRPRSAAVAPPRRIVARRHVHRAAAQIAGRTVRARPRLGRARAGRVLADRSGEPEGVRHGRRSSLVRGSVLRAGVIHRTTNHRKERQENVSRNW